MIQATRERSRLTASAAAILAVLVLLGGCAPDVAFLADPALEATLFRRDAFEAEVRDAARDASRRATVIWPDAPLGEISPAEMIASSTAPIVVLTPYLSLLVDELAPAFPDRRFVGYYGRRQIDNVTWVDFDPVPAMRDAGDALARWVFAETGRSATVVVDESDPESSDSADALAQAYEAQAGVPLARERFDRPPSREDVRSRLQAIPEGAGHVDVLLLGTATAWALEVLRDESTLVAYRDAPMPPDGDRVLFTVRDDLAASFGPALDAEGGQRIVVASRLVLDPDRFPAASSR